MDVRIRRYILAVMRNIYLRTEVRRRIAEDLKAMMLSACQDRPVEDVIRDMGSPMRMAKELMDAHGMNLEEMGVVNAMLYASNHGLEMKSKTQIGGRPLIHVSMGIDEETGGPRIANGIIAIGNIAKGWIAIGGIAIGGLAIGGLALGGLAFGGGALGLIALGGLALAVLLAIGGAALAGGVSIGGLAIALWTAIGGYGRAMNVYDYERQSASLPAWAEWLATHEDALGAFIIVLASGPMLYLLGVAIAKALNLDVRDIVK